MSEWRKDFNTVYKIIKAFCSISDKAIADAVSVDVASVRQYSGRRMTMPDNIDALCDLFENEIER